MSGDACASLTLTSFDANADAFTRQQAVVGFIQQSHARLLSCVRVCVNTNDFSNLLNYEKKNSIIEA